MSGQVRLCTDNSLIHRGNPLAETAQQSRLLKFHQVPASLSVRDTRRESLTVFARVNLISRTHFSQESLLTWIGDKRLCTLATSLNGKRAKGQFSNALLVEITGTVPLCDIQTS